MCVLFIAYKKHPRYPLVVLANRDEFYDRPTAPADRWADHPQVTAGRDLVGGGTWLGIADGGRFAAVTNYRDPSRPAGSISRGGLVADFLTGNSAPKNYLDEVGAGSANYSGFNLVVGSNEGFYYYSNAGSGAPRKLEPGLYGLSNHFLNTPWPKVSNGIAAFQRLIEADVFSNSDAFDLLADETLAADDALPDTGIGIEKERVLSPIFIRTPIYGTRSSTVVVSNSEGDLELEEKVFV
ncbi:MAG: NRDE family protein [Pyrinomonadaceae bacterium]